MIFLTDQLLGVMTIAVVLFYMFMSAVPPAIRTRWDHAIIGFGLTLVGCGWFLHSVDHSYLRAAWVVMLSILTFVNVLAWLRGRK